MSAEAEPLDQLLQYIEQRRREARHRLEDVTRQRAAVPRSDRAWAHEPLRTQAAEAGNELARLNLLASLTAALLRDPPARPRPVGGPRRSRLAARGGRIASPDTHPPVSRQDA